MVLDPMPHHVTRLWLLFSVSFDHRIRRLDRLF
jgi:hypothetical protein